MKERIKNIRLPDLRLTWTITQVWAIILGLVLFGWLFLKFWQIFTLAGIAGTAYWFHRKSHNNIRLADGVTLNPEAMTNYLLKLIREENRSLNPVLTLAGWGDSLKVRLKVDFPQEPDKAADFHSGIIYLKGYISRKLFDDFRIRNVKVEIEVVNRNWVASEPLQV